MLLRRGDRGQAVAAVQHALASLQKLAPADPAADPTQALFDGATDAAIRQFQQERGLIVDGIVGPVTVRSLTDARWTLGDRTLAYTLSAVMSGDDVTALQVRLAELGYNTGRPDGIFGPLTDACVRDFQKHRGLAEDGVFGADTYRELNRIGRMVTGGRPFYLREYQNLRQAGPRLHGKRIVIDPAHGGEDPGWTVEGVQASDLTWDIARRLESRMVATGMETFLTRGAHQNPTPEERAHLANEVNADLMLSLHIDGSTSSLATGIATFHFGTDSGATSTVGETLAELVQRELVARTQMTDCRVHHRTWDILRLTKMPAIQVELGYLSNEAERTRLVRDEFRNTLADGILVAVKRLYMDGRDDPHTGTFTFSELLAHEKAAYGV
ncbi:N-acetylmuramoyl-L-alanine amidase [Nakamurella panacisegetis]|uniref:N-acetylmuramoyl-L-alanine amidase n=1 Tax=Nakamurella panacisegetis TaxID=1090615 RepID=A0A1H0LVN4_9ACTN|nr:N-acetylmuramoyl-L-alanine amidase [Nakamurella panacisegetis]SDO72262.1 N-acetylmuramoyl-L-alanine amidase [Nakamurella panacisegetis]